MIAKIKFQFWSIFFILIFCVDVLPTLSQNINYGNVDSLKAKRKNSFLITPLVGYQQETRFAFGIASAYIFKTNKKDSTLRTSTIPTGIIYTQNEQLIIGLGANIFMPKENYIIKFEGTFSKFPDKFWGIGNATKESNKESYTFTQFFLNPQVHRKVFKNIFVGLGWEYQRVFNVGYNFINPETQDTSNFVTDNVLGINGSAEYNVSGADLYFTFDNRNHAYCPTKGAMFRVKLAAFNRLVGSDFTYQAIEMDFRKFITTYPKHVLALQYYSNMTFNDVPYRSLAVLGGNSIMRGFFGGRYRDKMFVGMQAEYRIPIIWRFAAVGFVSIGQVMSKIGNFSLLNFHLAFGPGLRISLLPKEKLNLRIDLGVTEKFNFQPYISIAESF